MHIVQQKKKKNDLNNVGKARTVGDCIDNFTAWQENGGEPSDCKNFNCCSNLPIFSRNREKKIIELISPSELHVLIGAVNYLYENMHKRFEAISELWAKKCNVSREILHRSASFAGNACKTLLNKTDLLREICSKSSNFSCMKYAQCFEDLRNVVDSCFSTNLKSDYTLKIAKFRQSFLDLGINVTPKIHVIFFHIEEFCEMKKRFRILF